MLCSLLAEKQKTKRAQLDPFSSFLRSLKSHSCGQSSQDVINSSPHLFMLLHWGDVYHQTLTTFPQLESVQRPAPMWHRHCQGVCTVCIKVGFFISWVSLSLSSLMITSPVLNNHSKSHGAVQSWVKAVGGLVA
jgi:hypothetical protein